MFHTWSHQEGQQMNKCLHHRQPPSPASSKMPSMNQQCRLVLLGALSLALFLLVHTGTCPHIHCNRKHRI